MRKGACGFHASPMFFENDSTTDVIYVYGTGGKWCLGDWNARNCCSFYRVTNCKIWFCRKAFVGVHQASLMSSARYMRNSVYALSKPYSDMLQHHHLILRYLRAMYTVYQVWLMQSPCTRPLSLEYVFLSVYLMHLRCQWSAVAPVPIT